MQSFQSQLPWAECPNVYFPNGSYAQETECVVSSKHNFDFSTRYHQTLIQWLKVLLNMSTFLMLFKYWFVFMYESSGLFRKLKKLEQNDYYNLFKIFASIFAKR